jgi:hypothetical protein
MGHDNCPVADPGENVPYVFKAGLKRPAGAVPGHSAPGRSGHHKAQFTDAGDRWAQAVRSCATRA